MKSYLQVFASFRMFLMLLVGFSSGIPLGLTGSTLQAWLATEKVDITTIGLFSLVGLPYTWKFLWAPILDRYAPGFLGRRRGWMLVFQLLLIAGIVIMAFSHPANQPVALAIAAVAVAFFSASQDIVVDAFRTEALQPEEYGAGSGLYIMGYRLAMLTSGALALILADGILEWRQIYFLMAGTMLVGVAATLLAKEPESKHVPRSLAEAVIEPLAEFFKRPGAIEVLLFIILYKLDVAVGVALMTKFFLDLGFTKTDIGYVTKVFGLIATILGALIGGAMIPRLGMLRALWIFGILQGATNMLFWWCAKMGNNMTALIITIGGENLASGMGTAAYSAFIMSLCNKSFTATQYALLTSLMAMTRVLAGAPTGYLQKAVGWEMYYIIATLLMIPGLLLLLRYNKWQTKMSEIA
jgi:MFS transporter, PAT family, beta-lactamase induction signal transducer AmpG